MAAACVCDPCLPRAKETPSCLLPYQPAPVPWRLCSFQFDSAIARAMPSSKKSDNSSRKAAKAVAKPAGGSKRKLEGAGLESQAPAARVSRSAGSSAAVACALCGAAPEDETV